MGEPHAWSIDGRFCDKTCLDRHKVEGPLVGEERRAEIHPNLKELQALLEQAKERANAMPADPDAQLDFAWAARAMDVEVARDAFRRALALGISDPKAAGLAKMEYADLLHPLQDQQARTHYLREARSDLRRASRASPNDLSVLRGLLRVYSSLHSVREQAAVGERIRQIELRQTIIGSSETEPSIRDRSGLSFETKCLVLLRAIGLRADLTRATGDGGIDIVAFNEQPLTRGKYIIQCKDWTNPVGEPVLRDLLGVLHAEDAVKGVIITSGTFTAAATRFAEGKRLELIDGGDLGALTAGRAEGSLESEP